MWNIILTFCIVVASCFDEAKQKPHFYIKFIEVENFIIYIQLGWGLFIYNQMLQKEKW